MDSRAYELGAEQALMEKLANLGAVKAVLPAAISSPATGALLGALDEDVGVGRGALYGLGAGVGTLGGALGAEMLAKKFPQLGGRYAPLLILAAVLGGSTLGAGATYGLEKLLS